MKYINKIKKYMIGRYGINDELNKFLFYILIFLLFIKIFINNIIMSIIIFVPLYLIVFRLISKNIYKRVYENNKFLIIKRNITKPFNYYVLKFNDKNHVYKKCYKCKTILKLPLPRQKGLKTSKCPGCGIKIKFYTFKHIKIEK